MELLNLGSQSAIQQANLASSSQAGPSTQVWKTKVVWGFVKKEALEGHLEPLVRAHALSKLVYHSKRIELHVNIRFRCGRYEDIEEAAERLGSICELWLFPVSSAEIFWWERCKLEHHASCMTHGFNSKPATYYGTLNKSRAPIPFQVRAFARAVRHAFAVRHLHVQ
jgi:hypothetical protein